MNRTRETAQIAGVMWDATMSGSAVPAKTACLRRADISSLKLYRIAPWMQ